MAWLTRVNLKDLGFNMICPGSPLRVLMSFLTPNLMMAKEAEDQEVEGMEVMGKGRATHLRGAR